MPRVSDEYRAARREQIARAAIRALSRKGVPHTSMADIIEEAGVSAGSFYSNFRDKAELGRYVARSVLGARLQEFAELADGDHVVTPRAALDAILGSVGREVPAALVVQFWAESTTDAALAEAVRDTITGLEAEFAAIVLPWARERTASEAAAGALAASTASALAAIAQSWILRSAIVGAPEPAVYLDAISAALG
ncbi:TetR family transcriptional regulator [Galbitalea sp. SE-J8]|uniref:TetR/AcrR family transcriptional regulator n=1 Tax=Galbitalea sp. SE-J8 TaxID=3054952 RepID=UPI00259C7AC7|nr:TetR family transcriptional regulator [Galbitalea sp. SE-J8]MDM4763291.1 TetR family transcriptional regulator [Galbitalea sp. SE-J8]